MASEKSKERLNEELNEEVTTTPNASTLSPMSTTVQITQINNQLPLKQLPVEKFQGLGNRKAWLNALTVSATDLGLWNVITGQEVKPEGKDATDATKLQKWKQKDLRAMQLILESISQEMHVELGHKQFNPTTTTSNDLLGLIIDIVLTEPERERLKLGKDFLRRFNPTDGHSFASTEAFIVDLIEEWTKIKVKYPNASDKWLNMVTITGLESLNETNDEPPLFHDLFDFIDEEKE